MDVPWPRPNFHGERLILDTVNDVKVPGFYCLHRGAENDVARCIQLNQPMRKNLRLAVEVKQ